MWSKKSWSVESSEKDFKPKILSRDEANALQERNLTEYRGLTNENESDRIETADMFHTADDPMREIMGSAYENNREDLFALIAEIEAKGIEWDISDTNRSMGYQPSPSLSGGESRKNQDGQRCKSICMAS